MNVEEFNGIVKETLSEVSDRLIKKGKEYTPGYDRLGNFKKQGRMGGTTPLQALRGNVLKHEAWADDIRNNETAIVPWNGDGSIMEHYGDIICYAILEMASLKERNSRLMNPNLTQSQNEYSSEFYKLSQDEEVYE